MFSVLSVLMRVDFVKPLPFVDLKNMIAERDRQVLCWKMKFEVVELEWSVVVVKKDQAVKALRGREAWLNSYLKSCCSAMTEICHQLKINRTEPEETMAGYLSWMMGACAQLEGIGQRIDNSLKEEVVKRADMPGAMFFLASEITVRR